MPWEGCGQQSASIPPEPAPDPAVPSVVRRGGEREGEVGPAGGGGSGGEAVSLGFWGAPFRTARGEERRRAYLVGTRLRRRRVWKGHRRTGLAQSNAARKEREKKMRKGGRTATSGQRRARGRACRWCGGGRRRRGCAVQVQEGEGKEEIRGEDGGGEW